MSLERVASPAFLVLVATLPWAIAPMGIGTALCAALTLPDWLRRPRGVPRTPVNAAAIAWLAALVLAALFAFDRGSSLTRLGKGLMPALVLLAAWHGARETTGRRALAVLLVSAGVAAIFGLIPPLVEGVSLERRARGPTGHYMTFAGQLLLTTSVAAGVALTTRRAWRLGSLAVTLTGTLALAATLTRSAWIGFALALAVLLAAVRPRLLPALALALAAAVAVAPPSFRARALSAFDPAHPANLERTHMWEAGLRMFRDRPLTGVGLQDLKPVYDRYRSPAAKERAGHLHSVPVQVAATMGVAGLAAFAWLVAGLFRCGAAGLRGGLSAGGPGPGLRLGFTAGLAAFLVAGLFEWNFGDEELLYLLYTLAGLAWAARGWGAGAAAPPDGATAGHAA